MTTKQISTHTPSESSDSLMTITALQMPVMVCAKHPTVETLLRCSDCMEPFCLGCLNQTATGYKCKACIEARCTTYDNHKFGDCTVAALAGFLAMLLAVPALTVAAQAAITTGHEIPVFLLVLPGVSSNSFASAQLIRLLRWSSGYRYNPSLRIYVFTGIWLGCGLGALMSFVLGSSFLSILLVLAFTGLLLREVNEGLK